MKNIMLFAAAATLGLSLLGGTALAETASLSRGSEIIGANVLNNTGDTIGKVDDLLIRADGKTPLAVLSVGGFLGVGARLVEVPYETLKISTDNKVTYPNGTKETLNALPEFKYAK